MAVSYARSWGDEIADITERKEYQTCQIKIIDPRKVQGGDYDVDKGTYSEVTDEGVIYTGQARYIPVRFSVFQGAGAQANTTTLKAGRIQLPRSFRNTRVDTGCKVFFTDTPFNGSLANRIANVMDDFQGTTTASRTIHVMLDADGDVS